MTNKLFKTTALVGMLFAFGGGTALAQSPADEVYNPNGGVLDVVESGTPTPAPTSTPAPATTPESATAPETTSEAPAKAEEENTTEAAPATTPAATATPTTKTQEAATGDLPFTGFEAGFVALAGLALLGGGLAMRRASREH